MPLTLLLTDGEQTVNGGDVEALYVASQIKDRGVDVVTVSFDQVHFVPH